MKRIRSKVPIWPMNAVSTREAIGSAVKANAAGNASMVQIAIKNIFYNGSCRQRPHKFWTGLAWIIRLD